MRRRDFLLAGASALALGGGALWLLEERATEAPARAGVTASTLDADFSPPGRLGHGAWEAIAALQFTAPAAVASTQSLAEVEDALITRLQLSRNLDIDREAFAAALAQAIRDDFRQGQTCQADGWILSQSECNVATLRLLGLGGDDGPATREQAFREAQIADVSNWGPRQTQVNTPVNVQPDGHSGIWIKASGAPSWVLFEIGGHRVPVHHYEDLLTTGLYGSLQQTILSKPGRYPVALVDEMARERQVFGEFVVEGPVQPKANAANKVFCAITAWGPKHTQAGQPANPQPDGNEALWIKTACVSDGMRVLFADTELATTHRQGLITARVPLALIAKPGVYPITLRDHNSGQNVLVGEYTVR